MRNPKVLTDWTDPLSLIESQYGLITYQEWCVRECERINRRGDKVKIVTRAGGAIALSR